MRGRDDEGRLWQLCLLPEELRPLLIPPTLPTTPQPTVQSTSPHPAAKFAGPPTVNHHQHQLHKQRRKQRPGRRGRGHYTSDGWAGGGVPLNLPIIKAPFPPLPPPFSPFQQLLRHCWHCHCFPESVCSSRLVAASPAFHLAPVPQAAPLPPLFPSAPVCVSLATLCARCPFRHCPAVLAAFSPAASLCSCA